MSHENKNNLVEIEGFKDHRGSFDIIDRIRQFIINAEITSNYEDLIKGMRVLISESAPYNPSWETDLKAFNKEADKIYDEKFWNNNRQLKKDVDLLKEFSKVKTNFFNKSRTIKAQILIKLSFSRLIPKAEESYRPSWLDEKDDELREELQALEEMNLT